MKVPFIKRTQCDNCGKINPKTTANGRLTMCCSTYDRESKNAFYSDFDKSGNRVWSIGKVMKQVLFIQWPFYFSRP